MCLNLLAVLAFQIGQTTMSAPAGKLSKVLQLPQLIVVKVLKHINISPSPEY